MIDWNHDGRIDYKDHAFYNNVVEPGMKKSGNSVSDNSNKSYSTTTGGVGSGTKIFIAICVLYFILELIGG